MKTNYVLCLLLFVSFALSSCEKEEERFFLYQVSGISFTDKPISGVNVQINSSETVGITGGVAPYTAEIEDEQIATASIYGHDADWVSISPVKLGSTYLTVKDASGMTARIVVEVVKGTQSFIVDQGRGVEIEGLEGEEKEALEKAVLADMAEIEGIRFVYDEKNSGELTVLSKKVSSSGKLTISFSRELRQTSETTFTSFFHITYNNIEHEFYFALPETPSTESEKTRALGPVDYWLTEDVTKKYQEFYPNVTSVKRFYKGHLSW